MSITIEELRSMDLHQDIEISGYASVMKVHGGWIYRFFEEKSLEEQPIFMSAVFVPDNGQ